MADVVLADDHGVARACLADRIRAEPTFSLLAEVQDGFEAVASVEARDPDVLLVAAALAGMSGFEVARRVHKKAPRTRVVVFAGPARESYALEALRAGAAGYVVRSAVASELLKALREAAAGRRYLSPPLSTRLAHAQARRVRPQPSDPGDGLTPREREVLRLAVDGLTSARIGEHLGISRRTAESHRASVLAKLGLSNQTELILYAVRRGILPIE